LPKGHQGQACYDLDLCGSNVQVLCTTQSCNLCQTILYYKSWQKSSRGLTKMYKMLEMHQTI